MAKILISDEVLEDYKKSSIKWQRTLLDLPLRAANDVLKYMRGFTGIRGKMRFGSISADSQFAPFNRSRVTNASVDINYRTIETYLGNVIEEFAPVDYAFMEMGYTDPIVGEAIKGASTAALVMMQLSKARGQHIAQAVLTGKRNEEGTTTEDLCDGLLTIAAKEIVAGNISEEKGNLYKLKEAITKVNACDALKEIVFTSNPFLRRMDSVLLCAPEIVDMYNEAYQDTHNGLVYNTQYNQPYIEGSGNKITLVGLPEMEGQKHLILTQTSNMLWATDNKSDESFVDVKRKDHYTLSMAANIFLGTQFHTIDQRRLRIIELFQG